MKWEGVLGLKEGVLGLKEGVLGLKGGVLRKRGMNKSCFFPLLNIKVFMIRTQIKNHVLQKNPTSVAHADITPLTQTQFRVWQSLIWKALSDTPEGIAGRRCLKITKLISLLGTTKDRKRLEVELLGEPGQPQNGICGKVVQLNIIGKDDNKLRGSSAYTLLSYVSFAEKPGYVTYEFSESFSSLVMYSKIYSMISTSVLRNISGKRALGLYTFLNDYAGIKRTPLLGVDVLRKIMGIAPDSYQKFKDLSKAVRSVIKNLKNHTDIVPELHVKYGHKKHVEGVVLSFDFQVCPSDINTPQKTLADESACVPIPKKVLEAFGR